MVQEDEWNNHVTDEWDNWEDDDWGAEWESSSPYVIPEDYEPVQDLSDHINTGHRLRDLRILADIQLEDLAAEAQISKSDLRAIEAGILEPSPDLAARLAAGIGLSTKDVWIDGLDKAA